MVVHSEVYIALVNAGTATLSLSGAKAFTKRHTTPVQFPLG
jgi:hypothetical protein